MAERTRAQSDTLDYIQSMLSQLHAMAKAERQDMLAYLIEMAVVEANEAAQNRRPALRHDKGNSAS